MPARTRWAGRHGRTRPGVARWPRSAGRTSTRVARTRQHPPRGLGVRRSPARIGQHGPQGCGNRCGVGGLENGGAVVDADDVHRLRPQRVGQQVDPGADHGARPGQQIGSLPAAGPAPRGSVAWSDGIDCARSPTGCPPAMTAAARAAAAFEANTRAPAPAKRRACACRPVGRRSVPHSATTTDSDRPSAAAVVIAARIAGASRPAGSGSAAWPSTTSSKMTMTSGSAACWANNSSRSVGSIIGCGRPAVNASSPRSTIAWPSPVRCGRPCRSGMSESDAAQAWAGHHDRLVGQGPAGIQPA